MPSLQLNNDESLMSYKSMLMGHKDTATTALFQDMPAGFSLSLRILLTSSTDIALI